MESEKGVGTAFLTTVMCQRERAMMLPALDLDGDTLGPLVPLSGGSPAKRKPNSRRSSLGSPHSLSPLQQSSPDVTERKQQHVLVVEDNSMNQLLLTRVLQLRGNHLHVSL